MRLILLFILLSLGADAQIIRANAFYRPTATQFLLDAYPNAAAAYSLRKINSSYTGNCIEVRRSNDNTTSNIGFLSSGELDTSALKTFVGANNGFIRTWYDQSGFNRDATQTTNANQPRIINSGTIERINGKPTIRSYSRSSSQGLVSTLSTLQSLPVTIVQVHRIYQLSNDVGSGYYTNVIAGTGLNVGGRYANYEDTGSVGIVRFNTSGGVYVTAGSHNNNQKLMFSFFQNSQLFGRINGVDGSATSYSGSQYNTASSFRLFGSGSSSLNSQVGIQEAIIYLSDQYSNRTGIETNINNYYGLW